MDGFPASGLQDIRDLQKGVTQAQGSASRRPPLTEASKGWKLGAMEAPDPGSLGPDDVHIRAEGGRLWVLSQDGDVPLGGLGGSVDDPPGQTSTPLGDSTPVLGIHYNKLGADNAALAATVVELLNELRGRVIDG